MMHVIQNELAAATTILQTQSLTRRFGMFFYLLAHHRLPGQDTRTLHGHRADSHHAAVLC